MVPSASLCFGRSKTPSIGIWCFRHRLGRGYQRRGQFSEGLRYDVQVTVHCPKLYQDVPNIGLQGGSGGCRGTGRWRDFRILSVITPGRAWVLTVAPLGSWSRGQHRLWPLTILALDTRRGGRGAAGQPVNKVGCGLWGGGDDGVEPRVPRDAGARGCRGSGQGWQERG